MTKQSPPGFFLRFFRWYCHPRLVSLIEGDLLEDYQARLRQSGKRKADARFIIDVLLLFRPGIIRPFQRNMNQNRIDMYISYFKTGWRNLMKNKTYSLINVGGLALGMTVAMFIGLWIYDEVSFNKYHQNYDRIAQVFSSGYDKGTGELYAGTAVQYPLADVLRNNYSQYFKHVTLCYWGGNYILSTGNDKFSKVGEFMDSNALEVLSLNMLQGDYRSLDKPQSIVLSRRLANAIYGDGDPIGKVLTINNQMEAEVTGVYDDLPKNNRFAEYEFIAPMSLFAIGNPWINDSGTDWDNHAFRLFVEIQPSTTFEAANEIINDVYKKYEPADFYKTVEEARPYPQLVPMSTWHLYSDFRNGQPATGRIVYVWLFGVVGLFVLILACINFVNLSIARSEKRAREVGVRKAIGSHRSQLIIQFLSESFLVVIMAFLLSTTLLVLLQDSFNSLADKNIELPFRETMFWVVSAAFVLLTAFLAGLYPAFYLSSFRPTTVLKGSASGGRLNILPRQILVVIQFSVSVLIIAGTLIVYRQIRYAQDRPVGYNREGLISIPMNNNPDFEGTKNVVLRNELLNTGVVLEAAASSSPITAIWNTTGGYEWPGKDPNIDAAFVMCKAMMEYGRTIGWEVIAGRDYSSELATDSINSIVINEAAAKYMGMEDPVGKEITDVDEFGTPKWTKTIIGVVRDVIIESPYYPVMPTLYMYNKNSSRFMNIRLKPSVAASDAIPKIKEAVEKVVPSAMFDYKFIDDEYAKKFGQEQRVAKLADVFSVLAIFISCLGLFGLASFIAEQRSKEIGIRKVMGASVSIIWSMLTKDFVILIIISCGMAVPLGYFLMDQWLAKYEYRIEIPWWIFLVTCLGALLLAVGTVSFQSIRAAMANPIRNLRTE